VHQVGVRYFHGICCLRATMAHISVYLVLFFIIFIDNLNNGFYINVPAVASNIRLNDSVIVLSVCISGNTFE